MSDPQQQPALNEADFMRLLLQHENALRAFLIGICFSGPPLHRSHRPQVGGVQLRSFPPRHQGADPDRHLRQPQERHDRPGLHPRHHRLAGARQARDEHLLPQYPGGGTLSAHCPLTEVGPGLWTDRELLNAVYLAKAVQEEHSQFFAVGRGPPTLPSPNGCHIESRITDS